MPRHTKPWPLAHGRTELARPQREQADNRSRGPERVGERPPAFEGKRRHELTVAFGHEGRAIEEDSCVEARQAREGRRIGRTGQPNRDVVYSNLGILAHFCHDWPSATGTSRSNWG